MSGNSIPDYQALMLPVLQASANGEVRIAEVTNTLAETLRLTPEQRAELLPSRRQTVFANRVHWAKTYLGKANLIEITRRGHFRITPRGQDVLRSLPTKIDNAYLNRFAEFREFKERTVDHPRDAEVPEEANPADAKQTPEDVMRAAHRQIESALAQDLLQRISKGTPEFFERLIVNLLLSMGYGGSTAEAGRAIGRSGDDGVDGVIDQDALGLDQVYIQAKRYASGNNIGPGAIRDFFGSLDRHKASKGLFVTTSKFSASARETAEYLSRRIVLIDGEQLAALMIRYGVGCREQYALSVKQVDEEFFE